MSPATLADTPMISSIMTLNANCGSAATRSCQPFHAQPCFRCPGCSSSSPLPPPPPPPPPLPKPPPLPPPAWGTRCTRCHLQDGVDLGIEAAGASWCRSDRARRWRGGAGGMHQLARRLAIAASRGPPGRTVSGAAPVASIELPTCPRTSQRRSESAPSTTALARLGASHTPHRALQAHRSHVESCSYRERTSYFYAGAVQDKSRVPRGLDVQ